MVTDPAPLEPGPVAGFRARSDYAAVLIHRGGALKAVEDEHPGEYIVAANLGTAYELSGDMAQAHRWIGEGIVRNPGAHEGTEWLHLRILEAEELIRSRRPSETPFGLYLAGTAVLMLGGAGLLALRQQRPPAPLQRLRRR
jgi:hypothetical protein